MRFGGTPRRSDGDRLPGRGIQRSGVVREMRKNPHHPLSIEVNIHQSSVNCFAPSSWMAVRWVDEAACSPLQKCGSLPSIVQIQRRLCWIIQNIQKSIKYLLSLNFTGVFFAYFSTFICHVPDRLACSLLAGRSELLLLGLNLLRNSSRLSSLSPKPRTINTSCDIAPSSHTWAVSLSQTLTSVFPLPDPQPCSNLITMLWS